MSKHRWRPEKPYPDKFPQGTWVTPSLVIGLALLIYVAAALMIASNILE